MGTASASDLSQPPGDSDPANPDAPLNGNSVKPDVTDPSVEDEAQLAASVSSDDAADSSEVDAQNQSTDMDFILYSGDIRRGADLEFIEYLSKEQEANGIVLVLCTHGGNPDAAYKIGRYIQSVYDSFKLFIPGHCKSAGTLLAIAAQEIIFSPFGELGPLDVQMARTDNIASLESGLNISEAFMSLEDRARNTFLNLITDITSMSSGIVSFQTASRSATEIVSALYGPIFSQIEPEDVGSRSRAMNIGEDYGKRLNQKFNNLLPHALRRLSQSYASHGFVIDQLEAEALFQRVRTSTEAEKTLAQEIGEQCLIPESRHIIENVTDTYKQITSKGVIGEDSDA